MMCKLMSKPTVVTDTVTSYLTKVEATKPDPPFRTTVSSDEVPLRVVQARLLRSIPRLEKRGP